MFVSHLKESIVLQLETSQNIELISAVPREHNVNSKCIQFLITYRTEVRFLAYSYRFVYCLDMSPSHVNVDIYAKQVLFDQILQSFKTSIEALSKQVSFVFIYYLQITIIYYIYYIFYHNQLLFFTVLNPGQFYSFSTMYLFNNNGKHTIFYNPCPTSHFERHPDDTT